MPDAKVQFVGQSSLSAAPAVRASAANTAQHSVKMRQGIPNAAAAALFARFCRPSKKGPLDIIIASRQ